MNQRRPTLAFASFADNRLLLRDAMHIPPAIGNGHPGDRFHFAVGGTIERPLKVPADLGHRQKAAGLSRRWRYKNSPYDIGSRVS